MPRVARRTGLRGITGRERWHGNRERLTNLLRRDPDRNIVLWAWTEHEGCRARYGTRSARRPVLRLTTPRAARTWLATP